MVSKATLPRPLGIAALLLMFALEAQNGVAAGDPQTGQTASQAAAPGEADAATGPAPRSYWPMVVGAQYTYVLQHLDALDAPYSGRLSLGPDADTQPTHTMGLYLGWAPMTWAQLYFDVE